jgi:type III secretory pathway component EscV
VGRTADAFGLTTETDNAGRFELTVVAPAGFPPLEGNTRLCRVLTPVTGTPAATVTVTVVFSGTVETRPVTNVTLETAGTIDMDEAKRRRDIVGKESQLYGAMDGAMKFVKGDAIAGLIIVAVNLLGGVMIGVVQRGMTAGESVKVYSILTIGDGLIAQIPALFVSICAGMIVTRVTSADGGPTNVGSDIGAQLLSQPKAFMIGSAIMLGFAAIPGMPTLTFLVLSIVTGIVGWIFFKGERKVVDPKTGKITSVPAAAGNAGSSEASSSARIPAALSSLTTSKR